MTHKAIIYYDFVEGLQRLQCAKQNICKTTRADSNNCLYTLKAQCVNQMKRMFVQIDTQNLIDDELNDTRAPLTPESQCIQYVLFPWKV